MNLRTKSINERDLTCFFCREFFTLYLEKKLDSNRAKQVGQHLESCSSCRTSYERFKEAHRMLLSLSETEPHRQLLEFVSKDFSFWSESINKYGWHRWSETTRWTAQLALVAIALVVTVQTLPWLNLARTLRPSRHFPINEVAAKKEVPPQVAAVPTKPPPVVEAPSESDKPLGPPSPVEIAEQKTTKSEEAQPTVGEEEKSTGASDSQTSMNGFVWLGNLTVEKIDEELTQRITEEITKLGGTKAGKVNLGWDRGDNTRYYHFILPEDNYEKLLAALNQAGFAELKKEQHPRVIKQGYMRIIMTMKEEKPPEKEEN